VAGLFITGTLGRLLKLPRRLATLIAVGTSICGVSAIVATAPTIDADEEEVAYAVSVITIFGLLATFVYPYLARAFLGGHQADIGHFLGTAIHDTSQVTAAAMVYADVFGAPLTLDVATVTKLVRNVSMALVIPFVALSYRRRRSLGGGPAGSSILRLLPLFVVGFLLMALARSLGDATQETGGLAYGLWSAPTWKALHATLKDWASHLLVVALAAVGLNTKLRILSGLGIRPFVTGLGAALAVGVVSLAAIWVL
jgi:uncharacterized integral membrane protein (TIGR00698 family)